MTAMIEHVVVGPDRHGVVRFGIHLDAELRAGGFATVLRRAPDATSLGGVGSCRGVHLQFTDRLFGADAVAAAATVADLASAVHAAGGRITLSLHDIPQPSDGTGYPGRADAYAVLADVVDGMVISSDHERQLLSDIGIHDHVTVIPLPIPATVHGACGPSVGPSVAVFGFVYPGKGHAEILDAMRELPPEVSMMAIGEPSAGHEDLIDELDRLARKVNRQFVMTGYVPDDALNPLLRSVTVPVVAHRHVSASGSLNSWLTAGRRPLVPDTRYVREIADRNPGALRLHPDDERGLASALHAAIADPSSTWLPAGMVCAPSPADAAASYARFLDGVHG